MTVRGLEWPIFRPLIKCGQRSLEVFCVGVFLAVGETTSCSSKSPMRSGCKLRIDIVGIAMLTAVAYCRSWVEEGRQAKPACRARSGISMTHTRRALDSH